MVATFPNTALSAQLIGPDAEQIGDFRVGVFAGVFLPNSIGWNGAGILNGLPIAASGDVSLKTGWAAGGLVGYSFTPNFNIDLELGYASNSFDKFDGAVSVTGVGNFAGEMPLSGRVHAIIGFVNFLITPFGTDRRITPYIGAGPGFAHATAKLQSFTVGGMALPVNSTSSETAFAADALVGFDVKLTQIASGMELGVGYEFVWIDAKHLGSGAGIQANTGAVSGHIFGAVLEYRF